MPSMTTTEDVVVKKKLRIKFGTKKFDKECGVGEIETVHAVPVIDDWGHSGKEKAGSTESEGYRVPSGGVQFDKSVKPNVGDSKKRELEDMVAVQKGKRRKMDRMISHQCSNVLKKLMTHNSSWPFLAPVDPVQLGIPDYFDVIRHPMDLGTIKSKIENNKYKEVDDFAADVRLTFSNAMTYNPPGNFVHVMAKELNDVFNMTWKTVEKRMGHDHSKEKSLKLAIGFKRSDSAPKLSVKAPAHQPSIVSKSYLPSHEINTFARPMEVEPSKSRQECPTRKATSFSCKGTNSGDKKMFHSTHSNSLLTSVSNVCTVCANTSCCCITNKDVSSGHPPRIDTFKANYNDHQEPHKDVFSSCSKPACQPSNSDPESDGTGRILGDDNTCLNSNITTDASSEEECQITATEVQLSPKRALRAAFLMDRFAGTILKAQQKKLLDPGEKVDAVKLKQQREILERKQREERLRLEAEIKVAEAAARKKAEAERRVQREKEREAARIALEEMEKTVEFDDTIKALKEIEILCDCPIYVNSDGEVSPEAVGSYSNPLQQLGLYMKDDCLDVDEEEPEDGEEGEIIP